MKRYGLVWQLLFFGFFYIFQSCGWPQNEELRQAMSAMVEVDETSLRDKVELFLSKSYSFSSGWSYRTQILEGSKTDTETFCHAEVCSCATSERIVYCGSDCNETCNKDWEIVHELLHQFSVMYFEDWDWNHLRFPGPYYQETVEEILR